MIKKLKFKRMLREKKNYMKQKMIKALYDDDDEQIIEINKRKFKKL